VKLAFCFQSLDQDEAPAGDKEETTDGCYRAKHYSRYAGKVFGGKQIKRA